MLAFMKVASGTAHVWDGCRLRLGYPGQSVWICQQTE